VMLVAALVVEPDLLEPILFLILLTNILIIKLST
jgi:hypothetical protein